MGGEALLRAMDVAKAKVQGLELAYVERGRGSPVVFVHGGFSDLRQWEPQMATFGARHRAIAYSRRGHWPNAPMAPGKGDTIQENADDLAGFLRAVGAAPAHLVGNSWGAFAALWCAVRHPGVVRSLVLEEPPVVPLALDGPPGPEALQRLARSDPGMAEALGAFLEQAWMPAQELFRRGEDDEARVRFLTFVLGGERFLRAVPQARVAQMRANLGAFKGEALDPEAFAPITEAHVRAVEVPTLLVTGQHSPAFLRRLSQRLEKLLPRAEAFDVQGASHIPHEQDPAAFDARVLGFLARAER